MRKVQWTDFPADAQVELREIMKHVDMILFKHDQKGKDYRFNVGQTQIRKLVIEGKLDLFSYRRLNED